MNRYGICDKCNKWGKAPINFRENFHFLKCGNCGSIMHPHINHPKEAGYLDKDEIVITVINQ